MVRRATQRGYTMMEVVVTLAVFGVFLFIIVILTAEMKNQEKKYPVNYMSHPDTSAVVTRMRRDVFDTKYLPGNYHQYDRGAKVVLLYCVRDNGTGETVVYDFRTKGDARRMTFSTETLTSDWTAHSVPDFSAQYCGQDPEPCDTEMSSTGQRPDVRLTAVDEKGRTAIDQILFKRPKA